jgi:hypothetical protein
MRQVSQPVFVISKREVLHCTPILDSVSSSLEGLVLNHFVSCKLLNKISAGRSWQIISYQSHLQSRNSCTWRITEYLLLLMCISHQEVSEYTSGAADINKEIFSAENNSLVLHDSRGYGAGELRNFQKLKEFITDRIGNANVGDRLHAIWYASP